VTSLSRYAPPIRAHPLGPLSATLALLLLPASPAGAASPSSPPPASRAVVILAARLDAERFLRRLETPEFAALREASSVGLMNAAVRGPASAESACLTLGAGDRVAAGTTREPVLRPAAADEGGTAAQVYERRLGTGPGSAAALHLGWAQVLAASASDPGGATPGALADALRAAGVALRYVGPERGGRLTGPGVLMAADRRGMLRAVGGGYPGETGRSVGPANTPEVLIVEVAAPPRDGEPERPALEVARTVAASLDPARDLLLVLSPSPATDGGGLSTRLLRSAEGARIPRWDRLCPALVWGARWVGARWLTSPTTRTPGLLANVDVAPTLLAHFGLPAPPEMIGHPAAARREGELPALVAYAHQARRNRSAYVPSMLLWGGCGLLAAGLALGGLISPCRRWLAGAARAALVLVAAFPAAMLVAAGFRFISAHAMVEFIAAAAVVLTVLCSLVGRWWRGGSALWLCYALTAIAFAADMLSGGQRLSLSIMSDFAVTGMRFYGLGNESTGVLIGMSLMLVPWWCQLRGGARLSRGGWIAAVLSWAALIGLIGWPGLGAEFGGALAALLGALAIARFCAAGAPWTRVRPREALAAVAAMALLALAVFAVDALRPAAARSHLGDLARGVLEGKGILWPLIRRKAEMNLRLLTAVPFVASLAAVAPVLLLWYYGAGRRSLAGLRARPLVGAGITGTLIAAVAALLLNDSGVVAWALATAAALVVWFDLLLEERPPATA
jgi:hypothetical protein